MKKTTVLVLFTIWATTATFSQQTINIPNPEFFWESPTGSFNTGSITQSIEFPTVYGKQVQLQKQQVTIAEKESYNDILLAIYNLYGTFYKKTNKLSDAAKQFDKAYTLAITIKDTVGIAGALNDRGLVHQYAFDNKCMLIHNFFVLNKYQKSFCSNILTSRHTLFFLQY